MSVALRKRSLRVDQAMIARYSALTGDPNPIHVDPEFAARTEMGGVIAQGTLGVCLLWEAIAETLGEASASRAELEVRFVRPVRVNDTITVAGVPEGGIGTGSRYTVSIVNQNNDVVVEGILSMA
jgi:3-hydroxybutyryl-CoA dehydratase